MTTPKINTTFRGGSRFYVHPDSQEKVPGVTSVLNMLPKPFLKAWAAKEVAETAVRAVGTAGTYTDSKGNTFDLAADPDWLTPMIAASPSGAVDYLKKSPDRNTREAADVGTAAHGVFEALALGQTLGKITPSLEIFARQYAHMLDTLQPTFLRTEDTVWSETHSYAGSFDCLGELQGERFWGDNKTTRSGVHAEVALQLAAYRAADYLIDGETGEKLAQPKADRGLVFHVRPEGWKVYEVPIGEDVFAFFLHLRQVFVWDTIVSRQIVGRPAAKGNVVEAGAA